MADQTDHVMRDSLLQEGVSCALATVHAIAAADLFRNLPADTSAQEEHNHGLWLLGMLEDQLRRIQQRVDALDNPVRAPAAEGR